MKSGAWARMPSMLLKGLQSYFCHRFASRCWYSVVAFGLPLCGQATVQISVPGEAFQQLQLSSHNWRIQSLSEVTHRSLFSVPVFQCHHFWPSHLHHTGQTSCLPQCASNLKVQHCKQQKKATDEACRDRHQRRTVIFAVFRCCLTTRGSVSKRAPIVV